MATISDSLTTVLVICDFDAADCDEIVARARAAGPIFARQPGFVSAALHVGENKDRMVQYLQWESVDHHYACQKSDDWKSPEGGAFWQLIQEGTMKIDAQIYTIADHHEGARA